MRHFLVVFDRRRRALLDLREFSSPQEALGERFSRERIHRGDPDIEVVVLGAVSESALRVTHSRYFETPSSMSLLASTRAQGSAAGDAAGDAA